MRLENPPGERPQRRPRPDAPARGLRALVVEDSEEDARLLLDELGKGGYAVEHRRVGTRQEMAAALDGSGWDIVLADHALPGLGPHEALALLKERKLDIPFIVVSAANGEDIAVAAMKAGAHDYVMKGKLGRMLPLIERELGDARERRRAREVEEQLRLERDRAQSYLDVAGVMFVVIGPDMKVQLINRRGCEMLERKREQIVGKDWFDAFIPARIRENVRNVFRQLMAGEAGLSEYGENPVVTGSGRERTIAWHNVVLHDAAGNPVGTLSSGEDITERDLARNALEASQKTVRAFLESIHDPAMLVDGEERIVLANQAFAVVMGKPPEELVGRNMYSFLPPEIAAGRKAHIEAMFRTGKPADFEDFRDGRFYDNRIYPVFDSEGRVSMATIIAMDITERKRAESALRESEERYRFLAQNVADIIFALDLELRFTYFTPSVERILGYSPEEAVKLTLEQLLTPSSLELVMRTWQEEQTQGFPGPLGRMKTLELEEIKNDGTTVWVETILTGMHDADGNLTKILGVSRDITARRKAQEALRESEARYRALFDSTPSMMMVLRGGKCLLMNPAGANLLGFADTRATEGIDVVAIVAPQDREKIAGRLARLAAGQSNPPTEVHMLSRSGATVLIESNSIAVTLGGEPAGLVIGYDITERRRTEEALQKSEKRYRELVDNLSEAVVELDIEGRILYISRQIESIAGFKPEELVGHHLADFLHPEDLQSILKAISEGTPGVAQFDLEFRTIHKDGHWIFASASGNSIDDGANLRIVAIMKDISERKTAAEELEERNRLLSTMNELSFDLASLSSNIDIRDFLVRRLREITGAPAVSFAEYNPAEKTLTTSHLEVDSGLQEQLGWLLGGPKEKIVSTVSADNYREITTNVVGRWNTLSEVSLGAIPPPLSEAIQQLLGVDRFIGVSYVVEGELFGTSLIAVKKDQPDPSFKLLRAFANMAGVSLRRRRAERALGRSEEKYRGLVDNAGAGVVTADIEANLTFINDALCRMIGYQPDELLGKPFIDMLHPEDAGKIMDLFIGSLRDETRATELEFRVRHKDGHYIHFYTSPTLSYENGEVTGFNGIMFDVSERKRAEEALAREKKFSDYIIDSVPGTFYVYDTTGHLVRWNKEEQELIGLPVEQIPQADGLSFFHEEDREAVARKMAEVFEKGYAEMEARLVRPDKEVRNFFITGRKMEVGDSVFLVGSGIDVTDRRKAEEALKRSEERFRLLAENAKDMIYRVRLKPKPVVEYVSPSALALTGYAPEEFYADPHLGAGLVPLDEMRGPDRSSPSKERINRPVTKSWQRKDGGTTWMEFVNHPVINAAGKIMAIEGVARDITERKNVEDALRESEEKFRDLAEQSPNMIFINVKGHVVYANRRCEELMGYTRDEFYTPDFDFNTLTAPEHRALVAEKYGAHLSGREVSPYEFTVMTKAGQRIEAILSTKLITYGGERALLGTITDITDRKKAEKALRESEDKFRRLFESAPQGIVTLDLEGRVMEVNIAALKIMNLRREEVVGMHFAEIPGADSADLPGLTGHFMKFLQGERFERLEIRIKTPQGDVWQEISPAILEKDGEPQAIQITMRDITASKLADEKVRASLKEKEVLLKEIHHRVKNNLQIIHSLLNMQSRRVKDRSVLDALRESQNRVRTMALIHERLYRSTDLSEIDFKEYINRLVGELYMSFGVNADQIKLELDLQDVKLGIDNAIPCGFIVNELVSNSLKHGFPDNRRGSLRIGLDSEGEGTIRLAVGDSGVGLPGELDFHKTQTLGLQLVCTLVDQLRGRIELDRSRGTEFIIRFNPARAEGG